ncbi:MAG: thioredoxin [Lachnospiraceae bacterium]|nr:thioredoxin [Lachnospiraceae bacterium]
MAVVNLMKDNFSKEVLENKGNTLIDFWAPWCAPCRMLSPVVDEVAEETNDVKICKVNVDEQQELAMQFGIMSIPTLVVLQDGKEIKRSSGFIPKQAIKELINS